MHLRVSVGQILAESLEQRVRLFRFAVLSTHCHGDGNILCAHENCTGIPISPIPWQKLSNFLIAANLIG